MAKALTQQLAEDPNKTTTPTCGRQLVRHIWDTFLILWKQRNNLVHNEATTTKAERQKIALTSRVQKCFDKQDQLNHDDRQKIFRKQQDELMEEDPRTIKTWVKLAERIIRTSKKEQRRQTGQREMMEQYFKWHPPEKGRHRKHSKQRHKQDLKPD
jgi:ribosomal protein L14E/L6E/L27E